MNLRGKTVLVTGGAVRIGKAMCAALAAEGMRVLIHCNKSLDEARMLCGDIEQSGQTAWVLNACLETREDGLRLMARARESAGPVDVLINNASVFLPDTLSTLAPDVMERQLRVNCWVPMYLTQAFAAQPGASGHVINMLDQRICRHDPGYLSYTASKKALAEFTCAAAQDLAPAIRVNAIAPGAVLPPVKTEGDTTVVPAGAAPLSTPCSLSDITDALMYLLRSDVITGQILYVDAGQHLQGVLPHG